MSNQFPVQNRSQVIVPIRFTRAVSGAPRQDAPDLDHRAWHNPHFTSWPDVGVRGALFGILNGHTVRAKLMREQLDSSARLYLTVRLPRGATQQIQITTPLARHALDASGVFQVQGTATTPTTGAGNIIEARLGSATGPVLGECEVRVFSTARVNVAPHLCTIHSTAAPVGAGAPRGNGTAPAIDVNAVMTMAKAIWRHAGIELIVDATRPHDIYSAPIADAAFFWGNAAGEIGWLVARPGLYVSTAPGRLNLYFIRYSEHRVVGGSNFSPLGLAMNRGNMATASLPTPGAFVAVEGIRWAGGGFWTRPSSGADLTQEIANDVAHEIGHFFTLSHFGGVNGPGRDDTYTRRNLMHPNNLLPNPVASGAGANNVRLRDCGYGLGGGNSGHRGCMLTMKQHNLFAPAVGGTITPLDCQAAVARMQIFQSPGRPFPSLLLY